MATLKEDSDNWKAGGIKRRDFRHSHDGPEVIKKHKKKNTKKWCKGKEGSKGCHKKRRIKWYSDTGCCSFFCLQKAYARLLFDAKGRERNIHDSNKG